MTVVQKTIIDSIWGKYLFAIFFFLLFFFDRYCDCDFKFAVKLQLNIVNNAQHIMSIVTLLKLKGKNNRNHHRNSMNQGSGKALESGFELGMPVAQCPRGYRCWLLLHFYLLFIIVYLFIKSLFLFFSCFFHKYSRVIFICMLFNL